jgi:hypothetical protein
MRTTMSTDPQNGKSATSRWSGLLRRAGGISANIHRLGISRWLEVQSRKLTSAECWFLAFRKKQQGSFWESSKEFGLILPPAGHYYADPCLIKKAGTNYIFFEDHDLKARKGTIACATIGNTMAICEPEVILDRDYHLSYPFAFEWQGEMYMIPETSANRDIELYWAREFPRRWDLMKVLMEGINAADTTLYQHDGKFWMFTSLTCRVNSDRDDLFLYISESPFGPWRPHPLNPVISDVSKSRPAGRLFLSDGCLVRPSQDCSGVYGRSIVLNRVVTLSEDDFREIPFARILPGALGDDIRTHTLSHNEDWEVRDGFKWVTKWELPIFGVRAPGRTKLSYSRTERVENAGE